MPNNNNIFTSPPITADNLNFYHQNGVVPIKKLAEFLADAKVASESGSNGIRYYKGDLQYETETYSSVTPAGTENPVEEGWLELDDRGYVLTNDTEVANGKTYYEQTLTWTTIQTAGGGTIIVQIPTITIDAFLYDGTEQGPTIEGLDSERVSVTNARKTDVGTYELRFALRDTRNMVWSDMTNADKTYEWGIFTGSWADSPDRLIVRMVEMADAGEIDLYEDYGWRVGDKRKVHLSAMEAIEVGESHVEQDVYLVLTNHGGKTLETAVKNKSGGTRTECSFQWQMEDCLKETGYMNNTATNSGGWKGSKRRAWCNNVFAGAVPSTLLPIFKRHINKTTKGSPSTEVESVVDLFALATDVEVFGTTEAGYKDEGTQLEYYNDATKRVKRANGLAQFWWLCSPDVANATYFRGVLSNGSRGSGSADYKCYLAVSGCF